MVLYDDVATYEAARKKAKEAETRATVESSEDIEGSKRSRKQRSTDSESSSSSLEPNTVESLISEKLPSPPISNFLKGRYYIFVWLQVTK